MVEHTLQCGDLRLDLSNPQVMGIVNVTPDSFSDGGRYQQAGAVDLSKVLAQVENMIEQGAAIIDVGGESTRPGAKPVSEAEELSRVIPVVKAIRSRYRVVVSVDTSTPEVIRQSADHGAGLINDVRALTRPGALEAASATQLPICLMHMRGEPGTMQQQLQYDDIVDEVYHYLSDRLQACINAGIAESNIVLDPGFGFGKSLAHNLTLTNNLHRFTALGRPLLVGYSRKSSVGQILDKPVDQRLYGSLAFAFECLRQGAHILRVHDVGPTCDTVAIYKALAANAASDHRPGGGN